MEFKVPLLDRDENDQEGRVHGYCDALNDTGQLLNPANPYLDGNHIRVVLDYIGDPKNKPQIRDRFRIWFEASEVYEDAETISD
jgi:hypothetical protein